ncbi:membrane dipeptidase [Cryptococcus neoformans]|nr:membrane dipeptidase [Cryptococcus neoformans var. grubii]
MGISTSPNSPVRSMATISKSLIYAVPSRDTLISLEPKRVI